MVKIKRELNLTEVGFFSEFQDICVKYNVIMYCGEDKGIYVVVDAGEDCMYNTDISFSEALDETDIDELFEISCRLHNEQVIE